MIAPNRRNETDRITRFQKARFCTLLQGLCGTVLSIIEVFFFLWANVMPRHILEWLLIAAINIFLLSSLPLRSEELQWKIMGHLLEKRYLFQSAVIGDEKVLVFGGINHQGNQLHRLRGEVSKTSELIDVRLRRVEPGAIMNVPHAQAAFVRTVDSNIIVFSGLDSDSTTTRVCELYDRKANSWRVLGALLMGRHLHTVLMLNAEEILVVGGYGEANYAATIAEAEIFNIRTGRSKFVQDFPTKASAGITLESKVWRKGKRLFLGGRTGGGGAYRFSGVYSFDSLSNQWKHEGEMPIASYGFGVCTLLDNQAMLYVGGSKSYYFQTNNNPRNNISKAICLETEQGMVIAGNLLIERLHCGVQPWNSEISLIVGGTDNYEVYNQTEWFDGRTGMCCYGPPLQEARCEAALYSFPRYDKHGKQISACVVAVGGVGANNVTLGSIEILEANNPTFVQTPSEEISVLRWKKIFSSAQFIGILLAFIIALILSLMYLLFQVLQIRRKSRNILRN